MCSGILQEVKPKHSSNSSSNKAVRRPEVQYRNQKQPTVQPGDNMSQAALQWSGEGIKGLLDSMGEEDIVVLKKMLAFRDYKEKMQELRESHKSKAALRKSVGPAIGIQARSETVGGWGIESWSDIQLKDRRFRRESVIIEEKGKREKALTFLNTPRLGLGLALEDPLATEFLVSLTLKDISFKVKERLTGPKRFIPFHDCFRKRNHSILQVHQLNLKIGNMIALMGASGAGKSTLLQILAGRYDQPEVQGRLQVEMAEGVQEGKEDAWQSEKIGLTAKKYHTWAKNNVAYVSQECHLWSTLTVRETLFFSALLYLPSSVPWQEKRRKAEQVMKFIGLEEVADVKVGNSLCKGISGGQQKRLSLGIELINAPPMLIVDEPTSGLDSDAAMKVINVLKKVAHMGRIVIVSIHQPSQSVFEQFDQVVFLNKGRVVFDGSNGKMHRYAASHGFRCPIDENPADYFMTVFSKQLINASEDDFKKWDKAEDKKAQGMQNDGDEATTSTTSGNESEEEKKNRRKRSYSGRDGGSSSSTEDERELESGSGSGSEERETRSDSKGGWEKVKKTFKSGKCNRGFKDHVWVFLVLLYRETLMICRDWVFMLQLPLGATLAAIIATLFADISGSGASLTTAFSLFVPFYFLQGYSSNSAFRLCDDHHILTWEVSQKLYHEMPFFLARWLIVESCYFTILALVICVPWYWIVGIDHSSEQDFFYFCLMGLMVVYFASSAARLYAMLVPNTTFVNLAYQVVALFLANMNGWFVTYNSIVDFWIWVFWINPYSYYVMAILPRELEKTVEGQMLLDQLDFPIEGHYYIYPLVILGETGIVLLISFLAFKFLNKKIM